MLAVLRKVEAASEAHLANIRERGKAEKARAKLLLELKRKPPMKKPPIRANEKRKAS
ncbi:MAG TPA: hypothetical protein VFS74_04160 [Gemmatimonadales bacterium]|jgi:hypothetical protein|nr:hypothetical protein [Gemmatimonadales bacterium]